MAGPDVTPVRRKILGLDRGQCLVGEADVVEGAVDFQSREVVREVELVRRVSAVEDEVEGERDLLGPVGVVGRDEVLSAEFQRVILLVGRVREGVDFSAEGNCPEDTKVPETTAGEERKSVSRIMRLGSGLNGRRRK